ncbi:hypothetical protein LEMLEM_LOCUS267 [Lemmus lemmus]
MQSVCPDFATENLWGYVSCRDRNGFPASSLENSLSCKGIKLLKIRLLGTPSSTLRWSPHPRSAGR